MLLADLGNTRGKFYWLEQADLVFINHWDYSQSPAALLEPYAGKPLLFASVTAEELNTTLRQAAIKLAMPAQQITTPATAHGVTNGYQCPEQLGVDRWLALVGARALTSSASLVIDVGTAMTVDLVDGSGQHKGGWILPGLNLMVESLLSNTAALKSRATDSELRFASNTAECISNGAYAAVVGAAHEAVRTAKEVLGDGVELEIFLTGGAAELVASSITYPHRMEPELVLLGLKQYAGCK